MAEAKTKRYYWDSCVFLSWLEEREERVKVIDGIIDDTRKEKAEIYSSYLSCTEVAYIKSERDTAKPDPDTEAKIDRLWIAGSFVKKVVEVTPKVAAIGKELIRHARFVLNFRIDPPDALHLATAMVYQCEEFHTYNIDDFKPLEGYAKLTVCEPHIEVPPLFAKPEQRINGGSGATKAART